MLTQAYCDIPWGLSLMAETLNFGIKGMDCVSWLEGHPRGFIIFAYDTYGEAPSVF